MFIVKYINSDLLNKIHNIKNKIIRKKVMNLYNYKKISINHKIHNDIDNAQFIKINDKEYYCATRNIIDTHYINDTLYKNIDNSKKHTIINKSISDTKFRNCLFFGTALINALAAALLNKYSNIDFSLCFNIINICNISYFGASSFENFIEKKIIKNPNYEVFDNMEEIYQEIINRFCLLAYSLNLTTPIEIMALYNLMYDNNLLSFMTPSRDNNNTGLDILLIDKLGYKVLLGGGAVCRNHSTIFRDICLRMGYNAKIIVGNQKDDDDNILGDHAIVEVKYNNKYIYIDPLNYEVLNFNKDKRLYSSNDEKLYLDNIVYPFVDKLGMRLSGFNKIEFRKNIVSIDEWKTEYKNAFEKLDLFDNYYKLEKFRYDNNDLFKELYDLSNILDTSHAEKYLKN